MTPAISSQRGEEDREDPIKRVSVELQRAPAPATMTASAGRAPAAQVELCSAPNSARAR